MKIEAAVLREAGKPFEMTTLDVEELRDEEILVRLVASGMCHADIVPSPAIPKPVVLGHEGDGIVERVGAAVRTIRPGDHVVLGPDSCGVCAFCLAGHSSYCRESRALNFGGTRLDGSSRYSENGSRVFGHFFGQSSFASHSIVTERNAVKVDADLPLELLGPLGCGVETGAGTVFNVFRPAIGSSIAIFGVGSVGMSALIAAVAVGCTTIIAVDVKQKRLDFARELGATHLVDASSGGADEAIRRIIPNGVDFALTTAGGPEVFREAVSALDIMGKCVFVALGGELRLVPGLLSQGRLVGGVSQGDSVPKLLIPHMIDLWKQGRFPFDRLISYFPFAKINDAAAASLAGDVVKPVLRMS